MSTMAESEVEDAAPSWFEALGYAAAYGEDIAREGPHAERESFGDVLLVGRLRDDIERLHPTIPQEAREDAFRKVVRPDRPTLIANNRPFHRMLRDGVEVEYRRADGSVAGDRVALVDYEDVDNNDWLAFNQLQTYKQQSRPIHSALSGGTGRPMAQWMALISRRWNCACSKSPRWPSEVENTRAFLYFHVQATGSRRSSDEPS